MTSLLWYFAAALLELAGCAAIWSWWRGHGSPWWLGAGVAALSGFALCLAHSPAAAPGRAFAAYAGVYLVGALAWLGIVDRVRPDRWDLLGGTLSLAGALVILFGRR
jgi:small multidrug resistance family-3 protein